MPDSMLIFKGVFLVGWLAYLVLLGIGRSRNRPNVTTDRRETVTHSLFSTLAFLGMQVVPLIYVFTPWLSGADYRLPTWAGWLGAAIFAGALGLTWKAHADLGRNWSIRMEVFEEHALVTRGIYGIIRHPIYAGQWAWGIAQALLIQNWIAGLAGLVAFMPIYLYRVPREERMMIDHFGDEYREYMKHTGAIIPRLGRLR